MVIADVECHIFSFSHWSFLQLFADACLIREGGGGLITAVAFRMIDYINQQVRKKVNK